MVPTVKSCGVLVFRRQPLREFLLMKHVDRWDLPKGHVDQGETELECALRELREETGITERHIRIDPTFRFTHDYLVQRNKPNRESESGPTLKTLVVFLGELINDVTIVPTEHPAYAWRAWEPPHQIQRQTIDPLLEAVERHWR